LGALGPLLGDLRSYLWDLEAVLGSSWGLLARSWAVLDGQEGQKGSEPENLADHGREILPPPSEIADLDPHPSRLYSTFQGQKNEERQTLELKNREAHGRMYKGN